MAFKYYELDRIAQDLTLAYRDKDVLKESHKMRVTVAYGLERFWGEHLRLIGKDNAIDKAKGEYWKATWQAFVKMMKAAGLQIPEGKVDDPKDTAQIKKVVEEFWNPQTFPQEDKKIALAVLTQLCDTLVWWTQRYNKAKAGGG